MDTPGFVVENKTKPRITAQIEGTASTTSAQDAARMLLSGVSWNRYYITNDILGELVRVSGTSAAPRCNSLLEV